jgi:hypothetical protein
MIIFDNSWNHPGACAFLRESGLIEVDMVGFCPAGSNVDVTSFFLDRDFRFNSRHERQPVVPIGGVKPCGKVAW